MWTLSHAQCVQHVSKYDLKVTTIKHIYFLQENFKESVRKNITFWTHASNNIQITRMKGNF